MEAKFDGSPLKSTRALDFETDKNFLYDTD